MGVLTYNIFLFLFRIGIAIASLFNPKAQLWIRGRKDIFPRLRAAFAHKPAVIWVHCASLGEFEQGRPLIEALKTAYPAHEILLTFFSPSGYENRKNYQGADHIFYLPADGASAAREFLEIVNPALVIFVKYEFWYYYLKKIKYREMPLILVSALFWEKMSFFKWYGALQRKMLTRFDHLFVQDRESGRLLSAIGLGDRITVSGDTRFDRVAAIAAVPAPIPELERFLDGNSKVIVAGSTWPADETLLARVMDALGADWKLVLAPHEIDEKHLLQVEATFPQAVRFTRFGTGPSAGNVLLIDNIGMLSRLYQYAHLTYIGGGFGKGIHNTLEAAVYGRPVFFGPVHQKFREASGLINAGAAFSINDAEGMLEILRGFNNNPSLWQNSADAAAAYVQQNRGATETILGYIREKKLL
ncbi:MAG: 3-deoxy-D-manno-octulosonic acid transferase [Chitinophagaceae bacterium]|nr:MAG: 3-deoxy-D-manno-octulosonic acid transferase [Chitinophagaceae bacterium]